MEGPGKFEDLCLYYSLESVIMIPSFKKKEYVVVAQSTKLCIIDKKINFSLVQICIFSKITPNCERFQHISLAF